MTDAIIIITVVAIILATIIIIKTIMWPLFQKYFFREKLNAGAILLNVQHTGVNIDNLKQVILQLQVEPDQGKNFVTELKGTFNDAEIASLHPGAKMFVTYNAHNRKKISLKKDGTKTAGKFDVQHSNN